jgi:hypothetical protein
VMGRRPPSLTKPKWMSLAQFSKTLMSGESKILMSGESQGQPDCVGDTREGVGEESVGPKRFATDVVAAMSNPVLEPNEEAAELPKRQFAAGKSEGG